MNKWLARYKDVEKRRAYMVEWRKNNRSKARAYSRKWYHSNPNYRKEHEPEKLLAREMVSEALRTKKLTRMPCENCGAKKTHAHHMDYAKPLDVNWLCVRHHLEIHGKKQRR